MFECHLETMCRLQKHRGPVKLVFNSLETCYKRNKIEELKTVVAVDSNSFVFPEM